MWRGGGRGGVALFPDSPLTPTGLGESHGNEARGGEK